MKIVPIKVDYLDHMGTDLDVVNAARVSFHKESDWPVDGTGLSVQDEKLIKYLAEHNHWSPFSHCFVKFRIKAPIFVARQLQKHTVGLAWNEVSRRYVDSEPEFWFPNELKSRPDGSLKQGAGAMHKDSAQWLMSIEQSAKSDLLLYSILIEQGVAPEQARMVLPQSTMTEWIWSGSLYAFARVCLLRLDSHSQKETQEVAAAISKECNRLFPFSWEALVHKDSD